MKLVKEVSSQLNYQSENRMSKKILVVDDDKVVLLSCKRILSSEGFLCELAESADEALRLIDKGFDLFIVDIKMPYKDGTYLIAELKRRRPNIPIIAMSGYNTNETAEESLKAGASRFIGKPFTPEELLSEIQKVLRRGENEKEGSGDR